MREGNAVFRKWKILHLRIMTIGHREQAGTYPSLPTLTRPLPFRGAATSTGRMLSAAILRMHSICGAASSDKIHTALEEYFNLTARNLKEIVSRSARTYYFQNGRSFGG